MQVPLGQVDCRKLEILASRYWMEKPTKDHLLSCFVNHGQVKRVFIICQRKIARSMELTGQSFKGKHHKINAAIKIQSIWRMHICRLAFKRQLSRKTAAITFMRFYAATRLKIRAKKLLAVIQILLFQFEGKASHYA